MPDTNLTRAEAAERSAHVRAERYDVDLDLTTGDTTFRSTTTVLFSSSAGTPTWLDLIAPTVHSITLNGAALDPAAVYDGARIRLDDVAGDNEVVVIADCAYMNTGEGLHRFVDPVDGEAYLYSQFEVPDSRRMYATFEQPDIKAEFALAVTAPAHWEVVSNGPALERTVSDDSATARWVFEPTPRISTYITALVAGPYHVVRDSYDGVAGTIPLGIYCRGSLAEHLDAEEILTITRQGFAFFESAFATPYPFAKYDQLFVPEFNAGAMENAGCVTFFEGYVFRSRVTEAAYEQRSNTILHEMAHMWFGDLVTMRWWDDLWLNESFAEWAAHHVNVVATRFTDAWTTFQNQRKAWAYRQDQLPSTHPIAADMVDLDSVRENFDGITYAKGAAALRQLVAWVGEDEFFAGLRAYFERHAWGNTSLPDLLVELEKSSGRELGEWTRTWLQTSGVNLLRPEFTLDDEGRFASFTILQEPPGEPAGVEPVLRPHRIGVGLYERGEAGLVRAERLELDVTGARTEVPELVGVEQPALLLLNDDDLTFAKIRLDPHSLATAVSSLGDLSASLPRALIWGAAWDMTRDAEMTTGNFVALVLSGLPGETDPGVVQQLLRQVRLAIETYAAPENRARYTKQLSDGIAALARAAEPGSDRQLLLVRGLSWAASDPEHLQWLQSLLDGSQELPGLVVDTDLRWSLLRRLAITGWAGEDEIAAEVARDDTATGRQEATFARAARPSADAKAAAWAAAVEDSALPNALLAATVGGFVQPEQRELLRPYAARYFASVVDVWATRTHQMASTIATGFYPAWLIEPTTVETTERFLAANPDLPSGLRRVLLEGRDGVSRALRCQRVDAAG